MALIVIALQECADMTVLWTAVNVNAVREGARRIDQLLKDAPANRKLSYARFLSLREESGCSVDVALSKRRERLAAEFPISVLLMTEDGYLIEQGAPYTKLHGFVADISLKDEAQQAGTPAHAFQLGFLHANGIAINVGDPSQTKLAVDSSNEEMKQIVQQIESRDSGIRCKSLEWVSATEWAKRTCEFFSLGCHPRDVHGLLSLAAIFDYVVNGDVIRAPTSADMVVLREHAPPQLTIAKSYRLAPIAYALCVACGYDHLVTYRLDDASSAWRIRLGELAGSGHNSRENIVDQWAQIVWIQPWGNSLNASLHSNVNSVLAIMIHMCMQQKCQYFVHLQLGVVISHRLLFTQVLARFDKQKPDFFDDLITSQSPSFSPDPSRGMLENIAAARFKDPSDVTQDDVVHVFLKTPWIVRDFVGITTSMSAVGSEKLDVLFFKQHPGRFVDREDQNIVAHTRQKGHLYVYCDSNRVSGFARLYAAIVFRFCPIVYWCADDSDAVKDRLSMMSSQSVRSPGSEPSQAARSCSVDDSFVSDLLEKASNSWESIPLCIAVHLTKDTMDEVKLLYARPYTPANRQSCSAPRAFWQNAWTSWSFDSMPSDSPRWSLRPRWPYVKLRVGNENVAAQKYASAMKSNWFSMNGTPGSQVVSVYVAIMPAYVFPTRSRWTTSDIMKLMLSLRQASAPPGLTNMGSDHIIAYVDISEDESTTSDDEDDALQVDHDDIGAASFSTQVIDLHVRAMEAWEKLVQDRAQMAFSGDCHLMYVGLSPELPWALLTFDVQHVTKPFAQAKLANIYSVSCQKFKQDLNKPIQIERIVRSVDNDLRMNTVLVDYLAQFFADLLGLLPKEPPPWWTEVVNDEQWHCYKSFNFVKFQLCRAFENMHDESDTTDQRSMFVAGRTTSHLVKQQVPAFIRLVLPRGVAVYVESRLRVLQQQNHHNQTRRLSFDLKSTGSGGTIGFELRPIHQFVNVYNSRFIHDFLMMGVTQNVSQEIGGSSSMAIRLMQPAYVPKDKNLLHSTQQASAANSKFISTIFRDYEACNSRVDDARASFLIGPTLDDITSFLTVLEKARSQDTIYKDKQLASFDFERYIKEGMRLDLLSTGRYARSKRSRAVSSNSVYKRQGI